MQLKQKQAGESVSQADPQPLIAQVLQLLAWVELVGGILLAVVLFCSDIPGSGFIAIGLMGSAVLSAALLFSFAALLSWVYKIKLNTDCLAHFGR